VLDDMKSRIFADPQDCCSLDFLVCLVIMWESTSASKFVPLILEQQFISNGVPWFECDIQPHGLRCEFGLQPEAYIDAFSFTVVEDLNRTWSNHVLFTPLHDAVKSTSVHCNL
jgi:hypothetical protein